MWSAQIKHKLLKCLIFMRYFNIFVFYIILVKEKELLYLSPTPCG